MAQEQPRFILVREFEEIPILSGIHKEKALRRLPLFAEWYDKIVMFKFMRVKSEHDFEQQKHASKFLLRIAN